MTFKNTKRRIPTKHVIYEKRVLSPEATLFVAIRCVVDLAGKGCARKSPEQHARAEYEQGEKKIRLSQSDRNQRCLCADAQIDERASASKTIIHDARFDGITRMGSPRRIHPRHRHNKAMTKTNPSAPTISRMTNSALLAPRGSTTSSMASKPRMAVTQPAASHRARSRSWRESRAERVAGARRRARPQRGATWVDDAQCKTRKTQCRLILFGPRPDLCLIDHDRSRLRMCEPAA